RDRPRELPDPEELVLVSAHAIDGHLPRDLARGACRRGEREGADERREDEEAAEHWNRAVYLARRRRGMTPAGTSYVPRARYARSASALPARNRRRFAASFGRAMVETARHRLVRSGRWRGFTCSHRLTGAARSGPRRCTARGPPSHGRTALRSSSTSS